MKPTTFKWLLHSLGAMTLLLITGVSYAFVFWPMNAESSQLRAGISEMQDFIATGRTINADNRRLKGSLAEIEQKIADVKRRIPDAPHEADFLAQLAAAADESNVELVDYRPVAAIDKESHHELTIQVSAGGDYAAVCRFLAKLEELPRLCHMTRLMIDAGDLNRRIYPFELTLQIFFGPHETENRDQLSAVVNR